MGISVSCDGDIIRAIHFYSGRDNTNFSRYPGELPFNIRWEDTREEIEARLGPPDEVRPGVHAIDAYYHRLALTINYDRLYDDDQAAKMQHVILQKIKQR